MSTQIEIVDESGNAVHLGAQLTTPGGEGSIYELAADRALVAKLYHNPPHHHKVEKLHHLRRASTGTLSRVAAWPKHLLFSLHDHSSVRGFVMPRIEGKEIHRLYGPRDRQLEFPSAAWDFLIHVARNCAAAFETIHENAVVMGDVNEKNLLVTASGIVCLIDCDSYQIQTVGGAFLCDVGVPLWTPPELQARVAQSGYHGLLRTPNHDRFGLAVLIFELLFMGRHPFAGVPLTNQDLEIHEAIQRYVFAFGPTAPLQGFNAPPNTLPLTALPPRLVRLFERAFLPGSERHNARPTGKEWAHELDALHLARKACPHDKGHVFWNGLKACPWCQILAGGGPNFFLSIAFQGSGTGNVGDIAPFWSQIQKICHGDLMRRAFGDVQLPSVTWRPMPMAMPISPRVGKPEPPRAIASIPAVTPVKRILPAPPILQESTPIHSQPLGRCEIDAFIGAVCAGICGALCLLGLVFNLMPLAFIGGILAIAFYLTWFTNRVPAESQRLQRLDSERASRDELLRTARTRYEQELTAHNTLVAEIEAENAHNLAEAEVKNAQEKARSEEDYRSKLSAYSAQLSLYENAWIKYQAKQGEWDTEVRRRESAVQQTRTELMNSVDRLKSVVEAYRGKVNAAIPSLEAARLRFESAKAAEHAEMVALEGRRREAQLNQFLDSKLIINHSIDRLRSVDVHKLIAYGIESALDITPSMRKIPGIGDVRRRSLLKWRAQCEAQFRFNPSLPLPQAEVQAVRLRHAQAKQLALVEVRAGVDFLVRMEAETQGAVLSLESNLPKLALQHAQAVADYGVCR